MASGPGFSASARWLGIVTAAAAVVLIALYAGVLVVGLATLPAPDRPIAGPLFTTLELLILLLIPVLVGLMAAIHAWARPAARPFALMALAFMAMLATVTESLHFVILTAGHTAPPEVARQLAFEWPSMAYALDILGWDLFFPLAALCAAAAFGGSRLERAIGVLLAASGVLALAGLGGVALGDMRVRNIGILGYAGVFPVAALLMAVLFLRSRPVEQG